MSQPSLQDHPPVDVTPTPAGVRLGSSQKVSVGENVVVVWEEKGATTAIVGHATADVVLLQGHGPSSGFPAIGAPVRLRKLPSGAIVQGRLAASGQADWYLVSLGPRGVRRAHRAQMDVLVSVRCHGLVGAAEARLVDMSRSGARLRGIRLPIGTDLDLEFSPPGSQKSVLVRAMVVRDINGAWPPELGVAFCLGNLSSAHTAPGQPSAAPSPPTTAAGQASAAPSPLPTPAGRPPEPPMHAGAPTLQFLTVVASLATGAAGVTVQTTPGAVCSISYVTPAGTVSVAQGLRAQRADTTGRASWAWIVSRGTHEGTGVVTVTADGVSASAGLELI